MGFTAIPLFGENDGIDLERMNSIINNLNYLHDTDELKVRYNAYGNVETENMKIACGATDSSSANTRFRNRWIGAGAFYTPGTRPIGLASLATLRCRRSSISIAQRTGDSPILDHTGMQVYTRWIPSSFNAPYGPNYTYWVMIGY